MGIYTVYGIKYTINAHFHFIYMSSNKSIKLGSSHFFSFSRKTSANWSIDKFVVHKMSIEGGCSDSGTEMSKEKKMRM